MQKSKIMQCQVLPDVQWNGKTLKKRQLTMEDFTTGVLTVWPNEEDVKEGDEIEFEVVDGNFGKEIKRPKKGGAGGGGGFKANPRKDALITSSGIIKSMIEQGLPADQIDVVMREKFALCLELLEG